MYSALAPLNAEVRCLVFRGLSILLLNDDRYCRNEHRIYPKDSR